MLVSMQWMVKQKQRIPSRSRKSHSHQYFGRVSFMKLVSLKAKQKELPFRVRQGRTFYCG